MEDNTPYQTINIFIKNLKYYMKLRGLDLYELADRANITDNTMHRYMEGTRYPNIISLVDIANVIGCTPNDLLLEHKED